MLVAVIVAVGAPDLPGLARHCVSRLNLLTPQRFVLVRALPRNAMGKLMRQALRDQLLADGLLHPPAA